MTLIRGIYTDESPVNDEHLVHNIQGAVGFRKIDGAVTSYRKPTRTHEIDLLANYGDDSEAQYVEDVPDSIDQEVDKLLKRFDLAAVVYVAERGDPNYIEDTPIIINNGMAYLALYDFQVKGTCRPYSNDELDIPYTEVVVDLEEFELDMEFQAMSFDVMLLGPAPRHKIDYNDSEIEWLEEPDEDAVIPHLTEDVIAMWREADDSKAYNNGMIIADALEESGYSEPDVISALRHSRLRDDTLFYHRLRGPYLWVFDWLRRAIARAAIMKFLPRKDQVAVKPKGLS